MLSCLSGLFTYLDSLLLLEKIQKYCQFSWYELNDNQQFMILDSQCLGHLEIIHSSLSDYKSPFKGSLYEFINQCKSNMGTRMLKNWILAPLLNVDRINDRLDAIQDLQNYEYERELFRNKLMKVGDLEKKCSQIYSINIKIKKQAIYFQDMNSKRLKLFLETIDNLEKSYHLVLSLFKAMEEIKSQRLKQLMTTLLPNIE